ncbi:hypothetical protein G6F66_014923 [Rhizopus arrhizus]|nr:hypothetical protein G6F66_014923 [Rhizopus arrhizus]
MLGEDPLAFCAVRPPGHHATSSTAMGFCLLNNIAIAAAYARDRHGLERIAVVDFDHPPGRAVPQFGPAPRPWRRQPDEHPAAARKWRMPLPQCLGRRDAAGHR